MKTDKREKMYRFLANEAESSFIESRYLQSDCRSISAFFRQTILNDMVIQNCEEELNHMNLLLTSVLNKLDNLPEEETDLLDKREELQREVEASWQQLQSILSTLRRMQH